MADQAGQDVVGVLPHRLGDDDRQVRVRLGEDFEALLLAAPHAAREPSNAAIFALLGATPPTRENACRKRRLTRLGICNADSFAVLD
jgi:hypothetical protein